MCGEVLRRVVTASNRRRKADQREYTGRVGGRCRRTSSTFRAPPLRPMSSTPRRHCDGSSITSTPRSSTSNLHSARSPTSRATCRHFDFLPSSLDEQGGVRSQSRSSSLEDAASLLDGSTSGSMTTGMVPVSPFSRRSPLNTRSPRVMSLRPSPMDDPKHQPPSESPTPIMPNKDDDLTSFQQGIQAHKDCLPAWLQGKQPPCFRCRRSLRGLPEDVTCSLIKEVIQRFPEDMRLQRAAARGVALRSTRHNEEGGFRDQCREAGLCDLLCALGERHAGDVEVLAAVLESVANLVTERPVNQEAMMRAGACSLLPRLMMVHGGNSDVQQHGLRCCASLAWRSIKCQAALLASGVCNVVVPAMQAFPENQVILCEGCRAVSDMAWHNPKAQEVLASTGVCEEVVKVSMMTYLGDDRVLQLRALQAITNMAWQSASNQERLLVVGACESVVTILAEYGGDRGVQYEACRAVDHLAWNNKRTRERLGQIGACQAVITTHLAFSSTSKAFQLQAIKAMASLASGCGLNQSLLGEAHACLLVVDAMMMSHGGDDRVMKNECLEALMALVSHHVENAGQLLEAGGVQALNGALTTYSQDRDLCVRGLRLLAKMSWSAMPSLDPGPTTDMHEEVIARRLCEIMVNFSKDRNLQLYGCHAIANMTSEHPRSFQDLLGSNGACEVVCEALKALGEEDHDVSWYALRAVANLAHDHEGNVDRLGKSGARDLVAATLAHFPDSKQIKLQGLRAVVCLAKTSDRSALYEYGLIAALAMESSENQDQLGEMGACSLCCGELVESVDEVRVQKLRAIRCLASNHAGNQLRFGQDGACESLVALLSKRSPLSRASTFLACQAMAVLAINQHGNQVRLWAAGAPTLLKRLVGECKRDPLSLAAIFWALTHMGWEETEEKAGCELARGVLPDVCIALRDHHRHEALALHAVSLISSLALCGELLQNDASEEGVASLVCTVARHWSNHKSIQLACIKAISHLTSMHKGNQVLFGEVGGAGVVSHALQLLYEDPRAMVSALAAMSSLASRNPINQRRLLDSNGAAHLMAALLHHSHGRLDPTISLYGSDALIFLAYSCPEARAALQTAGAVEYVKAILLHHQQQQPADNSSSQDQAAPSPSPLETRAMLALKYLSQEPSSV